MIRFIDKWRRLRFAVLLVLFLAPRSTAEPSRAISIVPRPVKLTPADGVFTLGPRTVIVAAEGAKESGEALSQMLAPALGVRLEVRTSARPGASNFRIALDSALTGLGEEGYRLDVTPQEASLIAAKPAGLFYGLQTLRQLLPSPIFGNAPATAVAWTLPCVAIEDRPRFRWRGAMLDVSRHFMPKEFVKRLIDLLALHKMNVFHWHLTDDQGWRIEIKKHPKLTEVGAWRLETIRGHGASSQEFDATPHGGFYTQAEIREIVDYARTRFVTIVPEIEMPGHAQAAIAAYPELGNTGEKLPVWTRWGVNENIFNANESTLLFLEDVLGEVLDLFPGAYVHVGGDEAVKTQWKKSPAAQARMKELGLKDEEALQSAFIRRMDSFLVSKGRRLIGWDEILEGGLAPNATVMSWRGVKGGIAAARAGHDVVMAPTDHTYFDHYQSKDTSR